MGSASFMNLMEVRLPQGLHVKNAVFCAVDGELAGIFALNYTLPDTVFPSLDALMREKVGPVLATRDFNLIPAMLHQRFKLAADKMDFPPVERRWELSDPEGPHNPLLTAVLCREGFCPMPRRWWEPSACGGPPGSGRRWPAWEGLWASCWPTTSPRWTPTALCPP